MKKITYAIYHGDTQIGGVYNVLASFMRGLLKGFKEAGLRVFTYQECIEKNIDFDVAIGFNVAGINEWGKVLNSDKYNLLWNVDSIFGQNFEVFEKLKDFEKFVLLNVSSSDFEPAKKYMPTLKHIYLPHATDKDLWQDKKLANEYDIVFLSSLYDFEKTLEQYKENKMLYGIIQEMTDIMLKQPNLTFWETFKIIQEVCKFDLDIFNYANLNKVVCNIVEQKQKVKMIQSLSELNVKVFGNDLWKKYIKGNVQYMGKADVLETVEIINKAKIAINCQTNTHNHGFHERFLNSSSVGVFNLVSDTPFIKQEFSDSFGYFNHSTFEDIVEVAQYYLKNNDERIEKAKRAQKIVYQKHLWKNRALEINNLFLGD